MAPDTRRRRRGARQRLHHLGRRATRFRPACLHIWQAQLRPSKPIIGSFAALHHRLAWRVDRRRSAARGEGPIGPCGPGRQSRRGTPARSQGDHRQGALCTLYLNDLNAGRILGKGGRPKKPGTIFSDIGRIHRHIVPLVGTRRVKDLTKADINKVLKDIMVGKTRVSVKTNKLRGKAIVRGGTGTATRTIGCESAP
jgi:hypothetical protein